MWVILKNLCEKISHRNRSGEIQILTVGVVIDKISYLSDKIYTYAVSEKFAENLDVGTRVIVPFGVSNSYRQGLIFEKRDDAISDNKKLKFVEIILENEPCISSEMLNMVRWIKSNYFCTYFEAAKLMFPAGINGNVSKICYKISSDVKKFFPSLNNQEKNILNLALNSGKNTFSLKDVKNLNIKGYNKILYSMISKGVIKVSESILKNVGEKNVKVCSLANKNFSTDNIKLSKKQQLVVDFLKNKSKATIKEIQYYTGVGTCVINTLAKKYIILINNEIHFSEGVNDPEFQKVSVRSELNVNQKEVFNGLAHLCQENKYSASLLYGVTGSGKTEVLLNLIDSVLDSGKSVIFMLPEIALTNQVISKFKSRYGKLVGVVHSAVSEIERFNTWKKAKSGDIKVIVGTRSAIFVPLKKLGAVIIDEEHEFTYKSDVSPRFNAKDVAKYRCKLAGSALIFASATPSMETYFRAVEGIYNFFKLESRFGAAVIPKVNIIDMNTQKTISGIISKELEKNISQTILNGHQAIIFMNRRGYSSFGKCTSCGEIFMCPECSVSLSYHKDNQRFMCHYCGYSCPAKTKCLKCGSDRIFYSGVGTQKIEDILHEIVPQSKILRIDSDIKCSDKLFKEKIQDFSDGKYDILIGTQMISKGFNFSNVTLVGVISADQALYGSDFRSYERAFSLLTQVIGRAGRGKYPGVAFIQTYTPENEILKLAIHQDYNDFFKSEIEVRKSMIYPPFADMCVIGFDDKSEKKVESAAREFFLKVRDFASKNKDIPLKILPPTFCIVKKVSLKFRCRIIMRCKNNIKFRDMISGIYKDFLKNSKFKNVHVYVDINPESIL